MKKIRIKICEFNFSNEVLKEHHIYKILKKYYDVEFSDDPEYLFYNDSSYEYLKYDCVKIFCTGENIHPNFNLCDYAIAFDYMSFGDRYYRYPLYLYAVFYTKEELARGIDTDFTKSEVFTREDLAKKTEFCSFLCSNYLADDIRWTFFDKLSKYKKVNSGGRYLNNVGGPVYNKLEFEEKHKFTIAFENSSNQGYITERLPASLAARTIPIYWGDPQIGNEFNEKRFINCHSYKNLDEVVERVKEIDNNDDLYLSIINQPATTDTYSFKEARQGLENFLRHIIDQPLSSAKRIKINTAKAREFEKKEMMAARYIERQNKIKKMLAQIYRSFKKIKFLENLKHKYFRKKYLQKG